MRKGQLHLVQDFSPDPGGYPENEHHGFGRRCLGKSAIYLVSDDCRPQVDLRAPVAAPFAQYYFDNSRDQAHFDFAQVARSVHFERRTSELAVNQAKAEPWGD